jgi:hypothetical protein
MMVSTRGPSMVTIVTKNLTMVISWASCCVTQKQSYWLVVPRGSQTSRRWKNQQRKMYTSDQRDAWDTGPCFVSYLSHWLWRLSIVGQMVVWMICNVSWLGWMSAKIYRAKKLVGIIFVTIHD